MTTMASILLILALLSLLSITRAQDRAPHGLVYENPMAFSPSAFDFFHPNTKSHPSTQDPCAASNCSPLPLAATVTSTLGHESVSTPAAAGRSRVGAGGIAGIVFGFVSVVLLATGVYYYVAVTRRTNSNSSRTTSVQPDA